MQKIIPTLWFNLNGEEAVNFYISLFEDGEILEVMRFPAGAPYNEEGTVATIRFQIFGQEYIALNGGPKFPFTNAVSFTVYCKDQAEIDRLWNAIEKAGGTPQQCGWITDQFGLPWQICPRRDDRHVSGIKTEPNPTPRSGRWWKW